MPSAATLMHIGVLSLHLSIDHADSLKEKRHAVKSVVAHLRNKFNVSASEVGDLDVWRRAVLGVAIVSNDPRFANQVLSQVVNHVEKDDRVVLENYHLEFIPVGSAVSTTDEDDLPMDVSDWFPT